MDQILATSGATSDAYIALRVLAVRGPFESPATLHEFLAGQPQLKLDPPAVAELLGGLEARGLVSGVSPRAVGPAQLTEAGTALYVALGEAIVPITTRLYADFDPADLVTAHRVLADVVDRANRLRAELAT
jgi:hypothetical protein